MDFRVTLILKNGDICRMVILWVSLWSHLPSPPRAGLYDV